MLVDFRNDQFTYHGDAVTANAVAGQTTDIDFKVTENNLVLTGADILVQANLGDYIATQVVDKDNVLGYGAGLVLDHYIHKRFIKNGDVVSAGYCSGIIPQGVYMRVKYTNTGAQDLPVFINWHLHHKK